MMRQRKQEREIAVGEWLEHFDRGRIKRMRQESEGKPVVTRGICERG
jgi:hypothetical protein